MRQTYSLHSLTAIISLLLIGATPLVPPQDLGWIDSPSDHLCYGHFSAAIQLPMVKDGDTAIKADKGNIDLATGRSVLTGHVHLSQPTQQGEADHAVVQRENGKIKQVDLAGHIRLHQNNQLVVGETAKLQMEKQVAELHDAWFRYTSTRANLVAWGHADEIQVQKRTHADITEATYTTCSPKHISWHVTAKHLTLDRDKETGYAKEARLWLGKVPVVYLPYFHFATGSKRKSGFLNPSLGYSSKQSPQLALPYYWNLAPNYDTTITTHWSKRRGFYLNDEFRSITKRTQSRLLIDYVPKDHDFKNFLRDNPEANGWKSGARGSLHFASSSQFSPEITTNINYNAVSDDYYLQDYHADIATITARHLLRLGEVNYRGEYWQLLARAQSYQTLEPLGQTQVTHVYALLPQITLDGEAPRWHQFVWGAHSQWTHFQWQNHTNEPSGHRFIVAPYVESPMIHANYFIKPKVTLHSTSYQLSDIPTDAPNEITRIIPIVQLDSGLNFNRDTHLFRHTITQTLEPRVMLLYVPYQNQNQIPLFDTGLMRFTTDSLWLDNRFSGEDRMGDTEQASLGITSRWLTKEGAELLRAELGIIHYFHQRRVSYCTPPLCVDADSDEDLSTFSRAKSTSPLAGSLDWHWNSVMSLHTDAAIENGPSPLNNASLRAQYDDHSGHLFNVGYLYQQRVLTRNLDENGHFEHDRLIGFSTAYRSDERWQWLAGFSYNLATGRPQSMLLGAQIDSCCWAVRAVVSRTGTGTQDLYNNNFFLQVLLKGLSSASTSSPAAVLVTGIPGYRDEFNQRGLP